MKHVSQILPTSRRQFLRMAGALLCPGAVPALMAQEGSRRLNQATDYYTVHRGDTLNRIAGRFSTTVAALKRLNRLPSDLIHVGQALKLREGTDATLASRLRLPDLASRRWHHVILHHSATAQGNAAKFDRYHRRRGMRNGLAYHFVIGNGSDSGDGEVELGNRWLLQLHGGHVKSHAYNQDSIGICLVGNFEETSPTDRQMRALIRLSNLLQKDLFGGVLKFLTHRELEKTLCPGRHFPARKIHGLFG